MTDQRTVDCSDRSPLLRRSAWESGDPRGGEAAANSGLSEASNTSGTAPIVADGTHSPYLSGVSVKRFRVIFGAVLMQYFIAFFDQEIMNSVHPVVSSEFNSSNHASWLETAFLLTSTTSQPLYARISDVIGRRLTNTFSLGAYALGTCLSGLAPSFWTFIAARALCGIGAGGVLGMAPIITNDLVPIRIRGTYQAYINLVLGLGASIGSISGGFLSDKLGWRWIFVFEIPPILAVLVVVYVSVPSSLGRYLEDCSTPKQHWNDFDVIGLSLFTILIALMISVLSLGGNVLSWTHPYILVSSSMSVLATAALVHVERRAPFPAMPFAKRLIQPNANLILSNLFAYMGDSAILFNAPLFFQAVKLQSASSSGARLGFPNLAGAVFGILSGFLISFTGRMKWPMVLGCTFMVVGSFLLSIPLRGVPNWLVTIFLLPSSIGMGLDTPATSVALVAACTPVDQAIMTSALNVFRRIGKILGVLISSTLFQNAMTVYLERFVTGANKIVIIAKARKSVQMIAHLPQPQQDEVIRAYGQGLQLTFATALVASVIAFALVLPIRLPSLKLDDNQNSG